MHGWKSISNIFSKTDGNLVSRESRGPNEWSSSRVFLNPPQHSQKVPLAPRLLPLHHVMFPAPHFLCSFEPTPSPQYDLPSSLV